MYVKYREELFQSKKTKVREQLKAQSGSIQFPHNQNEICILYKNTTEVNGWYMYEWDMGGDRVNARNVNNWEISVPGIQEFFLYSVNFCVSLTFFFN